MRAYWALPFHGEECFQLWDYTVRGWACWLWTPFGMKPVFEHKGKNNPVWLMSQSILRKAARITLPTAWIQRTQISSVWIPCAASSLAVMEGSVLIIKSQPWRGGCVGVSLVPDLWVRKSVLPPPLHTRAWLFTNPSKKEKAISTGKDRTRAYSPQGHFQTLIRDLPSHRVMVIIRYGRMGVEKRDPKQKGLFVEADNSKIKRHSCPNQWLRTVYLLGQIRDERRSMYCKYFYIVCVFLISYLKKKTKPNQNNTTFWLTRERLPLPGLGNSSN